MLSLKQKIVIGKIGGCDGTMEWKECPWLRQQHELCAIDENCLKESCPIVMLGERVDKLYSFTHKNVVEEWADESVRIDQLEERIDEHIKVAVNQHARIVKQDKEIAQLNQRLDNQQIDMDILRREIAKK